MDIQIREYKEEDLPSIIDIWNCIVEEGNAFPQMELLTLETAKEFFGSQSFTAVAELNGDILGTYILHPNNIGRVGHIANSSYAVKDGYRGMKIGEKLVRHSLNTARKHGFRIMQFNAVVKTNKSAIHIYEKIGFQTLGIIPDGFLLKDGSYEDIILYYIKL